MESVSLEVERAALVRARAAVQRRIDSLGTIRGGGADALSDEYIDAVVAGAIDRLRQELVVFGRIDDEHAWRVGLYGIDDDGEQLVIDWRAPFAGRFYRARFTDPMDLARRVTYVGSIDDLFVEEFLTGEIAGSSPLLGELSRSRGTEMRAAVATLQSEQDELVRLDPSATLVLRGGPGTGKTVVGLHRAAWLVYNDTRLTAGRILVVGPSDRFLRFVSAVLPTLGEARIMQTTFDRLLGPSTAAGGDPRWLDALDRLEASLLTIGELKLDHRRVSADDVAELVATVRARSLPWKEQRSVFVQVLGHRYGLRHGFVSTAAKAVWPSVSAAQGMRRIRRRAVLEQLSVDSDLISGWLAHPVDGALDDEIRARFEGVPATYGHVIVDEAQDLSLFQLRAVQRRSPGLTLVGDDAQRSAPHSLGLVEIASRLGVEPSVMDTAYRMSAEIADWLNDHAVRYSIPAVQLVGIRPTGRDVREAADGDAQPILIELHARWDNVALITADDTWSHKGVEYDAVVVNTAGMDPAQIYLAASRAAHELVVVR